MSDEIVDWFDGRYYHFTWEYRVSQTRVPIVNTRKRLNESHFITLQTSHSPLDPRRRRDALTVRHPPPRFPVTQTAAASPPSGGHALRVPTGTKTHASRGIVAHVLQFRP